ncbi:MAG: hypothetical protein WBN96_01170 [Gammaproteobacteria bacterium]
MIRAYSQRLLPPFSGFVQITESERARAQSFDGINWEIHYLSGNEQINDQKFRVQGYGLDRGYYNVASLKNRQLKTFMFPSCVDHDQVSESIHELTEFLSTGHVPFPAGDIYEYWLLDGADDSPLALIYSCCDESLMNTYPDQTEWTALPHSKMRVENTEDEQARNEPPVNDRFQRLIASRAGTNRRAAWFKRDQNERDGFPGLLVREDWQEQADHDLCQRYLMRKAPRLLMLQGLSTNDRDRLEVAAKQHVFEVEHYFPMYPEVNDQRLMTAIRVEARLRRATPQASETSKKEKSSTITPLSKDMRIIEN